MGICSTADQTWPILPCSICHERRADSSTTVCSVCKHAILCEYCADTMKCECEKPICSHCWTNHCMSHVTKCLERNLRKCVNDCILRDKNLTNRTREHHKDQAARIMELST